MSAAVCQKRHFDELHGSPPISTPLSKRRCGGNSNSPVRFPSAAPVFGRSSSPGTTGPSSPSSSSHDIFLQLRALYPDMDGQLVEKVIENCGNNLDDAIKCLNDLRLSNERPAVSSASQHAPAASAHQQQEQPASSEGLEWVELFVREMLSASDLTDARVRATRALESFEKAVTTRNAAAVEAIQKENETLKGQLQVMVKDNGILKRAVAIQHERYSAEIDEKGKEVKHLKQLVTQYQEQMRTLELNNYALTVHLRRAQDNSSIPNRYNPDVF
ncbi:uncharacterized protein LOC9654812 [Selaginella moellendorffii]|uniref:uncharacterized protein LOC9654812 n=1 Tax=Selaginella moellendorffii TaxID=88036 RepID=UPI000D1CB989|nr:uncharacterized protein LOC9654812 [Selaginella moellendorffii]|eukprot:XP_024525131.1 uncharacterized protein LOC9654812 [Selaginella moellendorffii]